MGRDLLITPSFLDAIEWCKKAPDSPCKWDPSKTWKEQAYFDLKNTLARIWTGDANPAIQRGMKFEATVYSLLKQGADVQCSEEFRFFLDKCRGGQFQGVTKSFISIGTQSYCLYGKMDCKHDKVIQDIKTTQDYKGQQKYLGNTQHKIYCVNEGIPDFEYLVAEFKDESSLKIVRTHCVEYHATDLKVVEEEIKAKIVDAMAFLDLFQEPGDLKELYLTKYNRF